MPRKGRRDGSQISMPTLIGLPIPACKRKGISSASFESPECDDPDYVYKQAVLEAEQSMWALIQFVLSLLDEKSQATCAAFRWLVDLQGELEYLEIAMKTGCLDIEPVRIDTEGVDGIDEMLRLKPDLYADDQQDSSLLKLLEFWLDEISRRGYELINVCIKAVLWLEARDTFKQQRLLAYPL